MTSNVISKLEADIVAAREEVTAHEAQLAAAQSRLAKLLSAKEILLQYGVATDPDAEGTSNKTLADRIEQLLTEKGPTRPSNIHKMLDELHVSTTQAAVNTTLSRMKAAHRATNLSGLWEAVSCSH